MSTPTLKILFVEDNDGDARLLDEMFRAQDSRCVDLTRVCCMCDAESRLAEHAYDIVLLDLSLPDAKGVEALRRTRAVARRIPLVVLTGLSDESLADRVLQEGAQEHLIKGQIESRGLMRALRYAIERKIMEDAVAEERERAQVTLNSIGDAVLCVAVSGNITFFNRAAEELSGWPSKDALGRPVTEVFRVVDAAAREAIANPIATALEKNCTVHLPANCVMIRRGGSELPIEDAISPIHNLKGQITGVVIVFRDASFARSMAQQMAHSFQHDFLTGLPNRMLLNDRASQAISLSPRVLRKVALLFVDLDGFKHINDSLGHVVGDQLLQSIAARLVSCVRNSDTVSRQGDDEFVVLLSDVERAEDVAMTSRRLLDAVAEPHSIEQHDLRITASIGVSVFPDDGNDVQTLIKNADTAMYEAKEQGQHTYRFFTAAMNVRAAERQSVESSLRRALEHQEFALHYQPKINLRSGLITGAEALIRWTHPVRGLVPPLEFVPVAEECGLIVPLGKWVLREACTQARSWLLAGHPVGTIGVNVSAIEFRNPNYMDELFAILKDTGLEPQYLELELTESVLMKHVASSASTLKTLRDSGVQIAVDDFGTGYSSLSYLRKFPIDTLKIDQSFIRQLNATPHDAAIVIAIINMGRSLNMRVVAEGVETAGELAFLQSHDCEEAQGYYFSRPVLPERFVELLKAGRSEQGFGSGPCVFRLDAEGRRPGS